MQLSRDMNKKHSRRYLLLSLVLLLFIGVGFGVYVLSVVPLTSQAPAPTPYLVAESPPTPEELLAQYENEVEPLLATLRSSKHYYCEPKLPSADEMHVILLPLNKRLYYPQELLYPDLDLGNPAASTKLYIVYDYARGIDLSTAPDGGVYIKYEPTAFSEWSRDTQDMFIEVYLFVQTEERLCIIERSLHSAGAGLSFPYDTRHRDLVRAALRLPKALKSYRVAVGNVLNDVLCYATGIDFHPSLDLVRRLALIEWALASPYWSDREQAAATLGLKGAQAQTSVALLIQTLKEDEELAVRRAATRALQSITGENLGADFSAWEKWWETQQ